MCYPGAFGPTDHLLRSRDSAVPQTPNTPRVNPFIRQPKTGKMGNMIIDKAHTVLGRSADRSFLRRQGMSEAEADRLARFAATRGGLDTFESVEAARRAMIESKAFTDEALVPAQARAQSRFVDKPINVNKTGAAELRGLPLIRRG